MEIKNSGSDEQIRYTMNPIPLHLPRFRVQNQPTSQTPHTSKKKSPQKFRISEQNGPQAISFLKPSGASKFAIIRQVFSKPLITSQSWIIIDANGGKVLDGKADNDIREIASLTKIMTCITAIQEINRRRRSYEEVVRVSKNAACIDGTSAELQIGDEIKLWDLLHGLMLPSGNDAAIAISEFIGNMIDRERDPTETFVERMNSNALALRLSDTIFTNPHGMSTSINLSSAKSVAILSCYAMKMSIFSQIVSTKKHFCSVFNPIGLRKVEWANTNFLLDKGFSGLKTGHTPAAGPCLSFSVEKKKKKLIGVLLNSKSMEIRWSEAIKLWKYAYSQYLY